MSGLDDAIHECSKDEDVALRNGDDLLALQHAERDRCQSFHDMLDKFGRVQQSRDNPSWWEGYKALAAERCQQPKRHWKGYLLGFDVIQIMFGAAFFQINGIPEGARIVGANHDFDRNSIAIIVEHESFPPMEDGDIVCYENLKVGYAWPKEAT